MFKIEAIHCKNCGSGLVVEVNDNITYCSSCGSGFEIVEGELQPIEINFLNPAIREEANLIFKPFWFIKSHVEILERTSKGGIFQKMFGKENENSFDLNFYIPAFYCSLETMKNLAKLFTAKNPVASPQKFNTRLTGFIYGKEDAKKLCEFILISFEAEKKDIMQTFRYNITFNNFEILGIPFYEFQDGSLKEAVFGTQYKF